MIKYLQKFYTYDRGVFTFKSPSNNVDHKLYITGDITYNKDYFLEIKDENILLVKEIFIFTNWRVLLQFAKGKKESILKDTIFYVIGNTIDSQKINIIRKKYPYRRVKYTIYKEAEYLDTILILQLINHLVFKREYQIEANEYIVFRKENEVIKIGHYSQRITLVNIRENLGRYVPLKLKEITYEKNSFDFTNVINGNDRV